VSKPILQYPDFSEEFILTTDASNDGAGAVLSQGEIGKDLPVAFASRSFNKAERNYSTVEKELAAIVWELNTSARTSTGGGSRLLVIINL